MPNIFMRKKCPACGRLTYIKTVFGNICEYCYYDPKKDILPKLTKEK